MNSESEIFTEENIINEPDILSPIETMGDFYLHENSEKLFTEDYLEKNLDTDNSIQQKLETHTEGEFQFSSLEEITSTLINPDEDWKSLAASQGGDVLKKENPEWIFKGTNGEIFSITQAVKCTEIENRHKQILENLYSKGYAVSELENSDQDLITLEIYFADDKGNISFEIFQKEKKIKTPEEENSPTAFQNDPLIENGVKIKTPHNIQTTFSLEDFISLEDIPTQTDIVAETIPTFQNIDDKNIFSNPKHNSAVLSTQLNQEQFAFTTLLKPNVVPLNEAQKIIRDTELKYFNTPETLEESPELFKPVLKKTQPRPFIKPSILESPTEQMANFYEKKDLSRTVPTAPKQEIPFIKQDKKITEPIDTKTDSKDIYAVKPIVLDKAPMLADTKPTLPEKTNYNTEPKIGKNISLNIESAPVFKTNTNTAEKAKTLTPNRILFPNTKEYLYKKSAPNIQLPKKPEIHNRPPLDVVINSFAKEKSANLPHEVSVILPFKDLILQKIKTSQIEKIDTLINKPEIIPEFIEQQEKTKQKIEPRATKINNEAYLPTNIAKQSQIKNLPTKLKFFAPELNAADVPANAIPQNIQTETANSTNLQKVKIAPGTKVQKPNPLNTQTPNKPSFPHPIIKPITTRPRVDFSLNQFNKQNTPVQNIPGSTFKNITPTENNSIKNDLSKEPIQTEIVPTGVNAILTHKKHPEALVDQKDTKTIKNERLIFFPDKNPNLSPNRTELGLATKQSNPTSVTGQIAATNTADDNIFIGKIPLYQKAV